MICAPTGKTGLNEVDGSWGMNVIARPRTRAFTVAASSRRRSVPLKRTSPPRMRAALAGRMPRIARARVVLPQPLSPTRPTTSPGPTSRLMPSSTCATPPSVTKSTLSPRTDSNSVIAGGAAAHARIEDVAQPVADQVEAHDRQGDGEPGGRRVPPGLRQELARLGDGPAPFGRGWRRPEPEEAERGGGQDRESHADRRAHDDRRGDVGQHVQRGQTP